jgi:hypothetical protein
MRESYLKTVETSSFEPHSSGGKNVNIAAALEKNSNFSNYRPAGGRGDGFSKSFFETVAFLFSSRLQRGKKT